MIDTTPYSAKSWSKYFFVTPLVMAFCMVVNLANAQQTKVKDSYPKPIKLTASQLAKFVGKYQYMDDYVSISSLNGEIVLKQLQGQHETINFYPSDLREFSTRHFGKPYWIMFSGKSNSKAPSFVTIDHDIWVRVK